ncbi:MAG: arsenate reductase family protein [Mariniphaga sp.]|nr:arsenate reductase family protein [Mariniphaga sp.]
MKIYHNSRCSKSRAGLAYLESLNTDFEIIKYIDKGLTVDELTLVVQKTGLIPFELVRTQEKIYKKNYKGKKFSDTEWIVILAENPTLLQRPIVINRDKAVLAQPPEEINKIF